MLHDIIPDVLPVLGSIVLPLDVAINGHVKVVFYNWLPKHDSQVVENSARP
jgi:hypothetical protein